MHESIFDELSEEEADQLERLINDFKSALADRDPEALESPAEALTCFIVRQSVRRGSRLLEATLLEELTAEQVAFIFSLKDLPKERGDYHWQRVHDALDEALGVADSE